uniref:DEP domain-containing protein n=1 Tax=Ditylenchus dipsaci TaxID=166011 RepID=A0A915E830_9BILA
MADDPALELSSSNVAGTSGLGQQPTTSYSASSSSGLSRRHLLLDKLDEVALKLVDSAQFKTHKYFRVAVPQAITGQSLVQVIQETFVVEDGADALHMATILLHYGYLFPVIEQSQVVKEDNTLYRLQLHTSGLLIPNKPKLWNMLST